jgi:ATP synthase protein I
MSLTPPPNPNHRPRSKTSRGVEAIVQAEKLFQIAMILPSSAFIGWLAGAWADGHLHQHWMGTAGILFGGISGLVYVVRMALASVAKSKNGAGNRNHNHHENESDKTKS